MRILALISFCIFSTPAALLGQTVIGEVVEEATGNPVWGAFVRLLDEQGVQRSATISDSSGSFSIRARVSGRYTLQVERIGHANVRSPVLDLSEGATLRHRVAVAVDPILLQNIEVTTQARCAVRPESGSDTERIWQEARKVLGVVDWAVTDGGFQYRIATARRLLNRQGRSIKTLKPDTASSIGRRPFETLPAGELVKRGFIQQTDRFGGYAFYAPDAEVLLSDAFLSTHCFWVTRSAESRRAGMIGLAFEPVRARTLPDISGVLWVDATTGELRSVEFTFTVLPWGMREGMAGGDVEFRRAANGIWIMQTWRIRIPTVSRGGMIARGINTGQAYEHTGFEEAGGEVRSIAVLGEPAVAGVRNSAALDSLFAAERPLTVFGRILDAEAHTPVAGAVVRLRESQHSAVTDSSGRFALQQVPSGGYTISVEHIAYGTRTESLLLETEARDITVLVARQAIALDTLTAIATAQPTSARLALYQDRRLRHQKLGLGRFWTREQIEQRRPTRLTDLLREISNLSIVDFPGFPGYYLVRGTRSVSLRTPCKVNLVIDGRRVTNDGSATSDLPFDMYVSIDNIEAIEVYTGAAQVPIEFGGTDFGCGVVVVWTK